ncbi:MAG: GtrA family protein [Candidatus Vogelbacteria bacterium]|nr:GtrA family protein [Candidatus Vogelbacteria bacterium]
MEFLLGPRGIIVRYLISGGTAAFVDLLILYVLAEYVHIVYTISVAIAFIFAFMVSFVMQKYWTFQDHSNHRVHKQAAITLMIALVNLVINSVLVSFFVEVVHIWYMLSQVIASLLIAIFSFFIYKFFVFAKPEQTIEG